MYFFGNENKISILLLDVFLKGEKRLLCRIEDKLVRLKIWF